MIFQSKIIAFFFTWHLKSKDCVLRTNFYVTSNVYFLVHLVTFLYPDTLTSRFVRVHRDSNFAAAAHFWLNQRTFLGHVIKKRRAKGRYMPHGSRECLYECIMLVRHGKIRTQMWTWSFLLHSHSYFGSITGWVVWKVTLLLHHAFRFSRCVS